MQIMAYMHLSQIIPVSMPRYIKADAVSSGLYIVAMWMIRGMYGLLMVLMTIREFWLQILLIYQAHFPTFLLEHVNQVV